MDHEQRHGVLGLVILVLTLALVACNPSTATAPAVTEPVGPAPTATETPFVTKVNILDSGEPLAPVVLERKPAGGQKAAPKGPIELVFDQPMDAATTAGAWLVTAADGSTVPGQVEWPAADHMVFTPENSLESGQVYFATLTEKAASKSGKALRETLRFTFQTAEPLQVNQVLPADGTSGIESQAAVTVIFNRPVVPLVIAEEQDTLPQPLVFDPPVDGKGEWLNTSIYIFRPQPGLLGGQDYRVTILAGLADAQGETSLAQDYSWAFRTAQPSLAGFWFSEYPWDNYPVPKKAVKLNQGFTFSFHQAMERASTEANLSLTAANGEQVPLVMNWLDNDRTLVISPTLQLALDTDYILRLGDGATAAGGIARLDSSFTYKFHSMPYPGIASTRPSNGAVARQFDGGLTIFFRSALKFDSWKGKIKLTPEPPGGWQWWYQPDDYYEEQWALSMWNLQSSTQYTLEILPGIEDLYGNKITQGRTVTFKTGPYPPSVFLQMPQGLVLYRADQPQEFYAGFRNVTQADVEVYPLDQATYISMQDWQSGINEWSYLPSNEPAWSSPVRLETATDKRTLRSFKPVSPGMDRLAPGLYWLGIGSPQATNYYPPFNDHRILLVADTNLTLKATNTEALAWLTDITSGSPVSGVKIGFYDYKNKAIGSAVTDKDGLARLDGMVKGGEWYQAVYAVVEDEQHFGFASSNWGAGVSSYDFGIWQDYYSYPGQARAYVYTDRPLYRPGQPVYYKVVLRSDDDGRYSLPQERMLRIVIESYENQVYAETVTVNEFGSYSGVLQLDDQAILGQYTISVFETGQENVTGQVNFGVAEYKKPEFIVDVTAQPEKALDGQNIDFTIQADYYSGGGLVDANVTWTLTGAPFTFTPPDEYSIYSFTDQEWDVGWYMYDGFQEQPYNLLAQGSATTDESGKAVATVQAALGDKGYSQNLVFEASVTDLSGTLVAGRKEVVAHRSMVYPGIRSQSYVGEAGKPQTFELVALDWDGLPLPGQVVDVEIVERRWNSVQSVDAQGRIRWESTVEDIPVAAFAGIKLDDRARGNVEFTPDRGGVYRAILRASDSQGNLGAAATYMWVAGDDYIPWRRANNKSIDLVRDRTEYAPGDTAEILIASPFQEPVYALVTVERGHIRQAEVIRLETNSTIYRLPISGEMAPNIYVSVLLIKGAQDGPPDFRMGMVELKVKTTQQQLTVSVTPDREEASPGQTVNYAVKVTDGAGRPVQAEVSLGLSDLAALNLAAPNSGPILDYFYYERSLSVSTAVPLVFTIEDYNAELAQDAMAEGLGMGSGGGKGYGEEGVIPVRGRFLDTAYWKADVVTGANGQASVSVELPDNLTTWRMDARAITQDTRAGQTLVDIVSTKPLLVRPQTPRFFTVGDEAVVGTAVHNNSGMDLTVHVSLQGRGVTVLDNPDQEVAIPDGRQAYVTWRLQVPLDSDRVDLVFSAEGGPFSDASLPPLGTLDGQGLPVYRYDVPEVVATSGMSTQEGTLVESIRLPAGWDIQAGVLNVRLAPSLAAGMTDGLTYLEHYRYECIEQTVSRFLPNVVTTRALHDAGLSNPELEKALAEQVNTGLQRIYAKQNSDGGWGWWSTAKSDLTTSAYVTLGLVEAQEAGYPVDQDVLDKGMRYLNRNVTNFTGKVTPNKLNRQAFVLYVLSRAGDPNVSAMVKLYDDYRQDLAIYARALLAESFWRVDTADPRINTLVSDLANAALLSATGTHWEEKEQDYYNWNTDTRTTAMVLSAVSQIDPKNPLNANATRWLMSHRQDGHWYSTQETAWSIMALTRWMSNSGELLADYDFAVAFNGETLGGGSANADTLRTTTELTVDIAHLLQEQSGRLAVARSAGPGNLYYTAQLKVYLPVEQVNALERGIQVQREYYRLDDPTVPITEARQGDLLLVKLTFSSLGALHNAVIDDPLPAGLEALDTSLKTSPSPQIPEDFKPDRLGWDGWGWWYFEHVELRDERVVISSSYLPAGTYIYTYIARASTPGTFRVVPTTAQEFYFPEVYGRGEGSLFTVIP